jgi:hypothetical protein
MRNRFVFSLLIVMMACQGKKAPVPAPGPVKTKASNTSGNLKLMDSAKKLIRPGSLVFRTGNDYTSLFFKQFNLTDKTYSHCGLACLSNDTVFIYHALGGEFNPNQKILRQTFETFVNPAENEGFGVFGLSFDQNTLRQVVRVADSFYRKGVMFDMAFDLNTNDRMYCAEFVYKSIQGATTGKFDIPLTRIEGKEGVATDNLFLNRFCRPAGRFVYK